MNVVVKYKPGMNPSSRKNLKKMTSERAKELGFGKWMTGKKLSEDHRKKLLAVLKIHGFVPPKGSHPSPGTEFKKTGVTFKGTRREYMSLHDWVRRSLGNPAECVYCGEPKFGKNVHWANISHEYRKDLSDWIPLCGKCHFAYDKKEGGVYGYYK